MLEKIKENKRLVAIVVGAILLTVVIIIFLVMVTSPSNNPPATGNRTPTTPTNDDNNNDKDTDTDKDTSSGEKATLEWWAAFLSSKDVEPLISKYEADNPGVKISFTNQVIKQSEIPGYQTKVKDVLSSTSGSAPDLLMIDNGWAGLFQSETEPAPDNIVTASQIDSNFYKFVSTDFTADSKVYGLPLWVDTFAFIYNKKLYDDASLVSPDADWQKFVDEQVPELTKLENDKIKIAGFSAAKTKNTEFWFEGLNILFLQNKVEIVGIDGRAKFGSDPDSEDAVTFYKQFADGNTAWNDSFNLDIAAFLEGKLATYMAPSWRLNDIVRYNEAGELNLNIGVSAIPQLSSSGSDKANMAMYWANVVNKDSEDTTEAWKFINFLTQPENLELLNSTIKENKSSNIGVLYPRKDMSSKQASDPYLGVYVNSLTEAKSWPMRDKIAVKKEFAAILDSNENLKRTEEDVNKILAP